MGDYAVRALEAFVVYLGLSFVVGIFAMLVAWIGGEGTWMMVLWLTNAVATAGTIGVMMGKYRRG